jgi:P27 family predicted phage terminase small subunit
LKLARGAQPCRINKSEPVAARGRPSCPERVLKDAVALQEWQRLLPLLENMGVLSVCDGMALGLYCVAFSRWMEAEAALKREGLVAESLNGAVKASPWLKIARDASDTMRRYLCEFGLSPSSRSSIKAAAPKDELADFIAGRKGRK